MNDEKTPITQRRKSEKRQRAILKAIRFTADEITTASSNAAQSGLSFGAYVRAAATGDAGPRAQRRLPVDAQLLRQILALHGKYGSNMNQIAYQLNAFGAQGLAANFEQALREWGEIRDLMF